MFVRANKVRYDISKFKHLSTNRLIRIPNEKMYPSGTRTCALFGLAVFFLGIIFLRESKAHRRNYISHSQGFGTAHTDPWIATIDEGTFKGFQPRTY
mmetsp:Transcript_14785/g.27367  ORF Transcript_14785/g.27367 Transcript_14785/m.27367 type:complete len:97 (-) Transcript_14785:27-317(-)